MIIFVLTKTRFYSFAVVFSLVRFAKSRTNLSFGAIISNEGDCVLDDGEKELISRVDFQIHAAVNFAVDKINRDISLLPNTNLEIKILNDCKSLEKAILAANVFAVSHVIGYNHTSYGIVSGVDSDKSVEVSYILRSAKVPEISFKSVPDDFSTRETLFRVLPPQESEIKAMIAFMVSQNWTYFSLMYSETHGRHGILSRFKQTISGSPVCFDTSIKLSSVMNTADYQKAIKQLQEHNGARVVILFTGEQQMRKIFKAVYELNVEGKYIWIGSSDWAGQFTSLPLSHRPGVYGAFTISPFAPEVKEFISYIRNLNPGPSTNSFLNATWELVFNCSLSQNTCNESLKLTDSLEFPILNQAIYAIDAVYVLGHALHALITSVCHNNMTWCSQIVYENYDSLSTCIANVSFRGYTGHVHFSRNRYRATNYVVKQIFPKNSDPFYTMPFLDQIMVKLVHANESYRVEDLNPITWDYLESNSSIKTLTPISACSKHCGKQEVGILETKNRHCCPRCHRCQKNEILALNYTTCQKCPKDKWPDDTTNFTTCARFNHVENLADPMILVLTLLVVLGMTSSFVTFIFFSIKRTETLLTKYGRGSEFLQLGAVFLGNITGALILERPSVSLCIAIFVMTSICFSGLYSPLLIKSLRLYKHNSDRTLGAHRRKSLVFFHGRKLNTANIIFLQLIVIATTTYMNQLPKVQCIHNNPKEKLVEFACKQPTVGLIVLGATSYVILILCIMFTLQTHKHSGDFNENRYIFICSFTTSIIWLVITSAYAASDQLKTKNLLIATTLILNGTIVELCLFIPKIIYLLKEDAIGHIFYWIPAVSVMECHVFPRYVVRLSTR